jgi:hypothetical protein
MVTALGCGPSDVGSTPTDHPSAKPHKRRVGRVWLMAAVSKTARAASPPGFESQALLQSAAVAQRKSVRLLTGRPKVRLLPAALDAIALVTQAGRVRSLKPRDGGASPPGGTNSVVAQCGRGSRSRACPVEVRLLSALPTGSAARAGRATASHAEGWEFKSPRIHHGAVV